MRKFLTIIYLLLVFSIAGYAQQKADTVDFKKHLGKIATLCDIVSSVKISSDTLTLLNMGGVYPHQKFIVAIKGNRISLDWGNLKGKHLCVTGVLSIFKEQLEIVAQEPKQIEVE
jgi:hypothetical protein